MILKDFECLKKVGGFAFMAKDRYTTVGYVHNGAYHTYNLPHIALEARFSKFDLDGNNICRPMEKFFNYGDGLAEVFHGEIDQDFRNYDIFTKYDGSMINPVLLDGNLVFMTKRGESEVATAFARWFDSWASNALKERMKTIARTITLNIEFTSPDNKIVLDYDRPKMVILSARSILSGNYLGHWELADLFDGMKCGKDDKVEFALPILFKRMPWKTLEEFAQFVRGLEGIEGYIARHKIHGYALKMKTQWYLDRHDTVGEIFSFQSTISNNGRLLKFIAQDNFDDVLPQVSMDLRSQFLVKLQMFDRWYKRLFDNVFNIVSQAQRMTKKDYALSLRAKTPYTFASLVFNVMDGKVEFFGDAFDAHLKKWIDGMTIEEAEKIWSEIDGDVQNE
jgi:T4 RnlA family RNA ligase